MKTQKYVVGFMFDYTMDNVALIRKNKPAWQAGLLNGIGGKIEDNETAPYAMIREFQEEAGVEQRNWFNFCSMKGTNNDGSGFEIEFFYCKGDLMELRSMEEEKLEVQLSFRIASGKEKTIGNLPWLVALAIDFGKGVYPPTKIFADYSRPPRL